jgi:hypothetical protein
VGADTVWEDTIEVVGDIVVEREVDLTIAPGSVVRFTADQRRGGQDPQRIELVVQGRLRGGEMGRSPVFFTSAAERPQPGDWYGIVMAPLALVGLENAVIEYAWEGLTGFDVRLPQSLEKVAIRQVSRCGLRFEGLYAALNLSRLEVSRAGLTGAYVEGAEKVRVVGGRFAHNGRSGLERIGGPLECRESEFIGNGVNQEEGSNLVLGRGVSGWISHNRFIGEIGINFSKTAEVLIEENVFSENRLGLVTVNSHPEIVRNEFLSNDLVILVSGPRVPLRIERNVIQGANRLVDNRAVAGVKALYNWWGGTSEAWIAERIRGRVEWRPFLRADPRLPVEFNLSQNYPNPFNGSTVINYSVGGEVTDGTGAASTTLEVRTSAGNLVRRWVQQSAVPGTYSVLWDGRNQRGDRVASGVYYYQLVVGRARRARRLVVLK